MQSLRDLLSVRKLGNNMHSGRHHNISIKEYNAHFNLIQRTNSRDITKFSDIIFSPHKIDSKGKHGLIRFYLKDMWFETSVIQTTFSYGREENNFELFLIRNSTIDSSIISEIFDMYSNIIKDRFFDIKDDIYVMSEDQLMQYITTMNKILDNIVTITI